MERRLLTRALGVVALLAGMLAAGPSGSDGGLGANLGEAFGITPASAQSLEQYENRRLRRQSQGDVDAQDASRRYNADRRGDAIAPRIERQQELRSRQADRILPPVGLRGRSTY